MKLKQIIMEDFCNYKLPSMFLATCMCDFKCCTELNLSKDICQNNALFSSPVKDYADTLLYKKYINNPITKSIVIGGLEPMWQIKEIVKLIHLFRINQCNDFFIIYTGYYPDEIKTEIDLLKNYKNIIIKFGRYNPFLPSVFDKILGVTLASNNQYAVQIS